jgi:hypothetical protein
MGVERRRTGFRLPWAGEAEDAEGEQSEADIKVDEMTAANGSAVPASESASDGASEGAVETSAAGAGQDVPAEPSAGMESMPTDSESADFLANLVGAMRGVAETSRDASLSELRTAIDERIDLLGTQGTEQEAELRRRADVDLEGVGEWEHGEIERIRSEAEAKRDARRRDLEQQLAERRTATDRQIEATRSRMAEHERDLAAFFAQLGEITDPAAFVSAAKRMPRAPDLDTVATTPPAVSASDPRLAALAMPTDGDANPAAEAESATAEAEPVAEPEADAEPEAEASAAAVEPTAETEPVAEAEPRAEAEPTASTEAEQAPVTAAAAADAHLAERLAQLDERLSRATQPVTASAAATNGGEQSTAIVVKGLGSFGAITSFKQALERVEGVRGVTLSLGPTGEFVYRASHDSDFDISAAIQSIEGPTASIEETDGMLVVTLSRTR